MILKLLVQLKWRDTIICLFLICGNNSSRKTLSFEGCLYSDKFSSFFKWNTLELFPSVGLNSTWAHKHQSDACERAAQLLCVVTCAGRQSSLQQVTAQLNMSRTWTSTPQHNTWHLTQNKSDDALLFSFSFNCVQEAVLEVSYTESLKTALTSGRNIWNSQIKADDWIVFVKGPNVIDNTVPHKMPRVFSITEIIKHARVC